MDKKNYFFALKIHNNALKMFNNLKQIIVKRKNISWLKLK